MAIRCLIVSFLLLLADFRTGRAGERPEPVASPLVAQLDADDYLVREQAEAALIAAGDTSIGPLEQDLEKASLEGCVRRLNALAAIASRSDSESTRDSAFEAMERLSKSAMESIAQQANAYLDVIRAARENESLALLKGKGATLQDDTGEIRFDAAWQGSIRDLRRLAYLKNIVAVRLEGDSFTDEALAQLVRLPHLEELTLKRVRLTATGLESLAKLESLTTLKLMYLKFDVDPVASLQKLRRLENASLFGTNLSPQQASELTVSTPRTRWDVRRGAFLGVYVQKLGPLSEVTTIQPRSAAQKAGVQIGDYLQSLAGEKIASFEDLQRVVGSLEAGNEVELELVRDEKPLKLQVKLGEWE